MPEAQLPKRGSLNSAGYDLTSAMEYIIPAHGSALIRTELALAIPTGHYGRIAIRSWLADTHGIDVGAGVIDCDYRGELLVLVFNMSDTDYAVNLGQRFAQLIIQKISHPNVIETDQLFR